MSGWAPYADTGRGRLSGSAFFHGVASRIRDPFAQWFGNAILRRYDDASWKNLVYYDDSVAEQSIDELPPCRYFPSIHLASFRSGWDPEAVMMLFKGGSNAWSHTHLDLNSFFIAAGGENLATDPGPEPYSVHLWHSVEPAVSSAWHNCIVVDGAHQRMSAQYAMSYDLEEAGDCYSRLCDHLSSERFEMIRGDATSAYSDALDRAWRDVIYLKPDTFVIFDDLRARPSRVQRNFEWMLHSEAPVPDEGGLLQACGERARLLIQPLFPRGWEWKHAKGKTIPWNGAELHCISVRPHWHHKWNVDPSRSAYPHWDSRGEARRLHSHECRFLVVLQALTSGRAAWALEPLEQGQAMGVRLSARGEECVALFNHSGEMLEVGDLRTDAEKAVIRVSDGQASWGAVRAKELVWRGQKLHASAGRASRVGETARDNRPR